MTAVYLSMINTLENVLGRGEVVDLSPEWGKFIPKLREQKLNPGSPRTPKDTRYQVFFRFSNDFEKKIKPLRKEI